MALILTLSLWGPRTYRADDFHYGQVATSQNMLNLSINAAYGGVLRLILTCSATCFRLHPFQIFQAEQIKA